MLVIFWKLGYRENSLLYLDRVFTTIYSTAGKTWNETVLDKPFHTMVYPGKSTAYGRDPWCIEWSTWRSNQSDWARSAHNGLLSILTWSGKCKQVEGTFTNHSVGVFPFVVFRSRILMLSTTMLRLQQSRCNWCCGLVLSAIGENLNVVSAMLGLRIEVRYCTLF